MLNALPLRLPSSRLPRDVVPTYAGFFATAPFGVVTLGGAVLSLAAFAGALFQSGRAYRENAAAIAIAGAVRAVVVVGLWKSGHLNLQTAVASMILMNVVQCGICLFALRQMLGHLPWN